jgi:uncharacterized protein YdcH (DUF465 family)
MIHECSQRGSDSADRIAYLGRASRHAPSFDHSESFNGIRAGGRRMSYFPDHSFQPIVRERMCTTNHEVDIMFEEKPQAEIEALMKRDSEFRQLYQMHKKLDKKVMDAELGVLPIDAATLAQMKREKLAAKEKLLKMYADSTNA